MFYLLKHTFPVMTTLSMEERSPFQLKAAISVAVTSVTFQREIISKGEKKKLRHFIKNPLEFFIQWFSLCFQHKFIEILLPFTQGGPVLFCGRKAVGASALEVTVQGGGGPLRACRHGQSLLGREGSSLRLAFSRDS